MWWCVWHGAHLRDLRLQKALIAKKLGIGTGRCARSSGKHGWTVGEMKAVSEKNWGLTGPPSGSARKCTLGGSRQPHHRGNSSPEKRRKKDAEKGEGVDKCIC